MTVTHAETTPRHAAPAAAAAVSADAFMPRPAHRSGSSRTPGRGGRAGASARAPAATRIGRRQPSRRHIGLAAAVLLGAGADAGAAPEAAATTTAAPAAADRATAPGAHQIPQWQDDGRLVFGFRIDAPPFAFLQPIPPVSPPDEPASPDAQTPTHYRPAGYSVEICRLIQNQLMQTYDDLVVEWMPVTAKDRFTKLADGDIDLLCGTATVSVERLRRYEASLFTFLTGASFVCARGSNVATIKDLSNKRIGYLERSTTAGILERLLKDAGAAGSQLAFAPDYRCAFNLLTGEAPTPHCAWTWKPLPAAPAAPGNAKREPPPATPEQMQATEQTPTNVDCFFGDRDVLAHYYRELPRETQERFVFDGNYHSLEPYAIFTRRGEDPDLMYQVNLRLVEMFKQDPKFRDSIHAVFQDFFGNAQMSDHLRKLFEVQRLPYR
jgi:ABC-type amino acid transport substrate-binding protein